MTSNERLQIKRLTPDAIIPHFATPDSAGLDLCSTEDLHLSVGDHYQVPSGLAMSIPKGYVGLLFPRSGSAVKKRINLINCVGVIDRDYRLEVKIPLNNDGYEPFEIKKGDRIGQLVIIPYSSVVIEEVDELDETERTGGFGSTGVR